MKKILLVEDNRQIRENTAEILELANYQVLTAENGKIGMEVAVREKPDLILCDIMMPVLDGYGVLLMIHKHNDLKDIPFIFLSAKSEKGDFRKGMDLGADDYLTKPFDGTELLNAIESRLNKSALSQKNIPPDINGLQQLFDVSGGSDKLQNALTESEIRSYKKKQLIYEEGNRPPGLLYVCQGKVRTFKTNEYGKEFVMGLYGAKDFMGYVPLLEGGTYKEKCEALEETEIAIIPKERFEFLMNTNRNVAAKFIALLAKNITEKEEQLVRIAYNSLRKKVADALLFLHQKYPFSISLTRENMAGIAGTATESMIRTLADFRSEGIIDIKNGIITILQLTKLENMAN